MAHESAPTLVYRNAFTNETLPATRPDSMPPERFARIAELAAAGRMADDAHGACQVLSLAPSLDWWLTLGDKT